ncbi:thiamine pyrophosphate-binding protein [Methylomonas rapida]|uniref:Thiamine pyrophosphate-binding protein n=1 Tax=Methylomonas rapida TaxID=2963939 RepID=A0ABY7GLL2_9GAMM|nr:thiamine pyrophosphate-binding protein [Methylomonas rapida]WAR45406.1 thiamine pyrophosphate-binding protein [Methylomonas rapida]
MFVADWVAEVFQNNAIDRIFLYPGGTIVPLINACLKIGIQVECFKSEQGAGYAALAYGRLTGKPQVVMVTSGPGVTNVLSCLADAYYDSTPFILITGQIGTNDLKVRKSVRQRGFQETPTVDLTSPISKKASCMMSPEDVFRDVPDAFRLAMAGRKGPVVIDFPMDMQRLELHADDFSKLVGRHRQDDKSATVKPEIFADIVDAASKARRPVLLLGQGALQAAAYDRYIELANRLSALVVTSFLGIGSFDTSDAKHLGYIGHTGHLVANKAVSECDFLLVLGSRLDVRQTGTVIDKFVPNGRVAWVNSDSTELANARVDVEWKIEMDVSAFCEKLIANYRERAGDIDNEWHESLLSLKRERKDDPPLKGTTYMQPRPVLDALQRVMGDLPVTVVTGVGCHQHWAARHLSFRPNACRLLTSGGHGTMGYDLPSAIGAAMAQPDRPILCVVGDGSLLMNIQELASLKERELNVKILVMNNSRLGLVSQFQQITWNADPTTGDFKAPNFPAIARGFGLTADRVEVAEELEEKIKQFWNQPGPTLLEVRIDSDADVVPMLLGGQHMGEMWMGRIL